MSGKQPNRAGSSRIEEARIVLAHAANEIGTRILGQDALVRRLLWGFCCGGHILLEGLPGLAKTTTVRILAQALGLPFGRVQMTPDILPGDILGVEFPKPDLTDFVFRPGPVFTSVLLVDELNRSPAKVQSALLEAMQERQVTIGGRSYSLPTAFWVVATQNPIDQEGTYPLAESQKDRFLMRLTAGYPDPVSEAALLKRTDEPLAEPIAAVPVALETIEEIRRHVALVHCADLLAEWAHAVVLATRDPKRVGFSDAVLWGVSPRGARMWLLAARTRAWWEGRDFVVPEDLAELADDVLSHRIVEDWTEASLSGQTTDERSLVRRILERIGPP